MEVNKIRIGNDIGVAWTIRRSDGVMNPLDQALNVDVQLIHQRNKEVYRPNYSLDNETVCFQFPALSQKHIGAYDLLCRYQYPDGSVEGGMATYTIDLENAFILVSKTSQEDNIIVPDLNIVNIRLSSSTEQAIRGESAYAVAVRKGFVGTEVEWLESLKQPAVDAANQLLSVIDEVLKSGEAALKLNEAALKALQEAHNALTVLVQETTSVKNETAENNATSVRLINELTALIQKVSTDFDQFLANCQSVFDNKINSYTESVNAVIDAGNTQQEYINIVEGKRVVAETGRDDAEKKRQTDTATAIANADTAAQNANTAADNANTAKENAETATNNANQAAETIDQKINTALVPTNEKIAHIEADNAHLLTKVSNNWTGLFADRDNVINVQSDICLNDYTIAFYINIENLGTGSQTELVVFENTYYKLAYQGSTFRFEHYENGIWNVSRVVIQSIVGKYILVTMSRKGTEEYLSVNSVIGNIVDVPVKKNIRRFTIGAPATSANSGTCYVGYIKAFDYAFTQIDIDFLYNQGRPLDVHLGDEWRTGYTGLDINGSYAPIADFERIDVNTIKLTFNQGVTKQIVLTGGNKKIGAIYRLVATILKPDGGPISNFVVRKKPENYTILSSTYDNTTGMLDCTMLSNSVGGWILHQDDIVSETDGAEFIITYNVQYLNVLNEFVPSGLSPTKWINMGANQTNIALINPIFTTDQQIKEISYCDDLPAEQPVATGQMCFSKSGKVFISNLNA